MKIDRLLQLATQFEKLAQVQLHPPVNPITKDYYTGSGKAGDVPHVYQDYETPKLTPLDYGDQPKQESPYAEHPYEEFSYIDRPQYYRSTDPTYRNVPTSQQVKYQPGQKPAPAPQPKETLPQFLTRTFTTLKSNQSLAPADANLWKQYQPTLKARWEQLKKLPTPTPQQQQEKGVLDFVFGKLQTSIPV